MRLESLRWPSFAVGVGAAALSLASGATPLRLLAVAAGIAGWWLLSRRKARCLDRDRRGVQEPR